MSWWKQVGAAAPKSAIARCMCSSAGCEPRSRSLMRHNYCTPPGVSVIPYGPTLLEKRLDLRTPDVLALRDLPGRVCVVRRLHVARSGLLLEPGPRPHSDAEGCPLCGSAR